MYIGLSKYYPRSYHTFNKANINIHIHQNIDTNFDVDRIIVFVHIPSSIICFFLTKVIIIPTLIPL